MYKDNIDVEFETIEKQKEITFDLERECEYLFNEYLATKDTSIIDKIISNLLRTDYYKTGEMKRMGSIVSILAKEISNNVASTFSDGIATYQELYDKYVTVILLLRRIEMAAGDEFSNVSYEVLPDVGIYAVLEIIKSEYFERRMYILKNLFTVCKSEISDAMKLEWLYEIIESYPDEYWYIEMAELYLDYEQHANALMFLEKIENPNDEIGDLIKTLKEYVGGAV